MRHAVALLLLALFAAATAACGDDGPQVDVEPSPPSSPGTGTPVRGTERLMWDQAAPSFSHLQQYTFRIYVDGAGAALAGVECLDSSSAGVFPCTAPLPPLSNGVHSLQLSAAAGGLESPRSNAITVSVNQGRTIVEATHGTVAPASGETQAAVVCVTSETCFTVHSEATSSLPLSSPSWLPDGRLLFVEDGRYVRARTTDGGAAPVVLSLPERSRVIALLVDPQFERSRIIRVAWAADTVEPGRFGITALRELHGRLGEPSTIVDLEFSAGEAPRVAQDDGGRIYVAMPENVTAGSRAAAGQILRFSGEGLAWSAGLGAPLVANTDLSPRALVVEGRERLWVSGSDASGRERVQSLPIPVLTSVSPARAVAIPSAVLSLAAVSVRPDGAGLLATDDRGLLAWIAQDGRMTPGSAVPGYHVLEVAGGSRGALVVARSAEGTQPAYTVFRLEPVGEWESGPASDRADAGAGVCCRAPDQVRPNDVTAGGPGSPDGATGDGHGPSAAPQPPGAGILPDSGAAAGGSRTPAGPVYPETRTRQRRCPARGRPARCPSPGQRRSSSPKHCRG